MRAQQRLRKLEQANASGMVFGFYERRPDCEASENGVTHAWIDGEIAIRGDYKSEDDFVAAIEMKKHALADMTLIWLPSDPRLL